jgi:hypothetical protein
MNPLVVLLMAASTTAADPLPVVTMPAAPVPAYAYTEPASAGTTERSRPHLFSRLRKLFHHGSPSAQPAPVTAYPALPGSPTEWNVWGAMPSSASVTPPTIAPAPAAAPLLRPVPVAAPPDNDSPKRMPAGSPF